MLVLIDNYDSFTYNLVQMAFDYDNDVRVYRNDAINSQTIRNLNPDGIIFSPGPGTPEQSGNMKQIIQDLYSEYPMLGICLGHQAIGEVFGCRIKKAAQCVHGKQDQIEILHQNAVFDHLPSCIKAGRYHSLAIDPENFSSDLQIDARSRDQTIMAISHRNYPVYGIQFHPESILTPLGSEIIKNFIHITKTVNLKSISKAKP